MYKAVVLLFLGTICGAFAFSLSSVSRLSYSNKIFFCPVHGSNVLGFHQSMAVFQARQPDTGRDDDAIVAEWMRMQEEKKRKQELGLVDAFGASLEKKPTLSVGDDQAKWKAEKLAKEAADKQAAEAKMAMWLKAAADKRAAEAAAKRAAGGGS